MKLSVIIVNYNVKFFLEQCLQSVFSAMQNISGEVFVVDNNSVDGSASMVKAKFSQVVLIENNENLGFSKANNKAIVQAAGEYILLLNPDTVVEEDTFSQAIEYLDFHTNAGALGVKMIDGKGNFLPESKRGLPTPLVAFYKIFGISTLLPKSKIFGKYHLTYLDKNKTHKVDVLCGAFMMLRKSVLEKVGILDETFFMYGEDIDLSYRIQKAGFEVIYYPHTTIIHYKGESTKKSSLNYVYLFYKAMQVFAQKHFTGNSAKYLHFIISIAIYLRASISLFKRILLKLLLPILDILFAFIGFIFLASFWGKFWFNQPAYYPSEFYTLIIPAYIIIWLVSLFYSGAYDSPIRFKNVFGGILAGLLIILILYALSPSDYRFSRMLIISGASLALVSAVVVRVLMSLSGFKQFQLQINLRRRILIAGSISECERIKNLLEKLNFQFDFVGYASDENTNSPVITGSILNVPEIVRINKINEVIFCSKDISNNVIINLMLKLSDIGCDYKIAPANSESIIGSNSINTAGDLYVYSLNSVATTKNKRLKRTFDLITSIMVLITSLIWIWIIPSSIKLIRNLFQVIRNKKTWIGYSCITEINQVPYLKPGVFFISDAYPESKENPDFKKRLDNAYAQDYKMSNDFILLAKSFKNTCTN